MIRAKGANLIRWLRAHDLDAVLSTTTLWIGHPRQVIRTTGFPFVSTGSAHPRVMAHSVDVDQVTISRLTLNHLRAVGFRSCGYLITTNTPWVLQRYKSFAAEAKREGLWEPRCLVDLRTKLRNHFDYTVEIGSLPELKKAIRMARKPVAFCSHNDFAAAALLDWLLRNGYRVPAEVGVVGCDDDPLYSLANIGLTTIQMPVDEMGRSCAEILLGALNHPKETEYVHKTLMPALVVRASTVAAGGPGDWLLNVLEAARAHLASKELIPRLCARTGWRYETIARRFKKALGMTILQYRDQTRLDQAAELLRQNPGAKIASIGRQVGFSSPGRFAAAFRKRHGVSPRHMRG